MMRNLIQIVESQLLLEKKQINLLNLKHDFEIPGIDIPGAQIGHNGKIASVASTVRHTVKYHLWGQGNPLSEKGWDVLNKTLKWFSTNLTNWIINHEGMPTNLFHSAIMSIRTFIEQGYLEMNADDPRSVDDILALLPEWARDGYIMYGAGFETFWDMVDDLPNYRAAYGFDQPLSQLLDYIVYAADAGIRVERMSVDEAMRNSTRWHKQKINTDGARSSTKVMEFPDGYYIGRLTTPEQLDYETAHCRHCIGKGTYDHRLLDPDFRIYSLRDGEDTPHATMTVILSKREVQELQGFENGPPPAMVWDHLVKFMAAAKIHLRPGMESQRAFGLDDIELT